MFVTSVCKTCVNLHNNRPYFERVALDLFGPVLDAGGLVPQLNMISCNLHSSKFCRKGVYFLLSSQTAKSQKRGYSEHPSPRNLKKGIP